MFLSDVNQTPETIAQMDPVMQPFYQNIPMWNWVVYGLAVFAGLLGCIGLLLKKSWARIFFILSLVGILLQNYYSFFVSDAMEAIGSAAYIMPTIVITIGVLLLFLSRKGMEKGWLS